MNKEPLRNYIQHNSPASPQIVETITDFFEPKEFAKNDFFLKEGKISTDYLFLTEGLMRAFSFDTEGNEVTTYFYTKNRMVFEAASFFTHTNSAENIQAVTGCKGFTIPFEKLNGLFHSIPEFREFGRLMLVKGFVEFKQRTLALITRRAEERYADLMNSNPEIVQYAQLKHIASYLGITDTSLSRIRKEFSKR
ncbi:Crp/Fnr family transcriptional regulator [Spirosoma jeollabukense]